MERMDKAYLFSEERLSSRYDDYEHDVFEALMGTKNVGEEFHSHTRYPYPQLKARQIREAVDAFYGQRKTVRQLLREARDVYEARRRLASEVSGLGPKQSSLFLRNIGYGAHVAVLDVHVLTYMNWLGLIPAPLESVRTVRHYETIENTFIEHATSAGYSPHYFDLAVWIVVRVAKKEYKI
jgi:N-glycosylase/DNA lyase